MAVYIYTRVSTVDQVEGTSLSEQDRKCRGAAMMGGLDVTTTFIDAGISGGVALSDRPEGSKLADQLQPGDTVIAAKIDRLFRSAADALTVSKYWHAQGIRLVIAEFGHEPVTENGTSKLLFGILAMTAEFEKDLIRQRMSEGRTAKKAKGGHIGGTAPFGYRKVGEGKGAMLEPLEAEQRAIVRIVELRDGGQSFRIIADAIQKEFSITISHMAVKSAYIRTLYQQAL